MKFITLTLIAAVASVYLTLWWSHRIEPTYHMAYVNGLTTVTAVDVTPTTGN